MRRALISAAAVLAALSVATATAAEAGAATPAEASELGRQAYQYGFPLLDLLRIRREETSVPCPDGRGNAPVNHLANAARFATPDDRTVVAPNTDTLYSIAHLDLGKGPVILRHPDMGKRFFDFELVDPYTNVIGYVGTRTTGSERGRFAIAWNERPGEVEAERPGDQVEVPAGLADRADAGRRRGRPARRLQADEPLPADEAEREPLRPARRLLPGQGRAGHLPDADRRPRVRHLAQPGAGEEPAAEARRPDPRASWRRSASAPASPPRTPASRPTSSPRSTRGSSGRRRTCRPRRGSRSSSDSVAAQGWITAGRQHRRLRHRLRLPGPDRDRRDRREHAGGGDVPGRARRLRRQPARRLPLLPDGLPRPTGCRRRATSGR